ncbi:MAG: DUF4333 domain-containing protein [Leptolyngbyaceae cyanobacterium SM1_4_3]|nr:DUF4333 domain-containing protein [Leptolyngbyaceae cyanobacterium SM1_4_3]
MRRGVGTISLLMFGLALTGCQRGIRTEEIETAILQDLESQGEIPVVSVSCPQRVQPEVEEAFNCMGNLDSGDTFLVTVTPQDETGNVEWEIPNSKGLLNLTILEAQFQEEIAGELGVQPTIDCGSTYRVNRPGDSFECAVAGAIAPSPQSDESTQASSAQTSQSDPANSASQPEPVLLEVVVSVDQQGNVNWQQIRRVQTAQTSSSAAASSPAASPTASPAATRSETSVGTDGGQSVPAADTSSESQTAEDFLDDPGALDDF